MTRFTRVIVAAALIAACTDSLLPPPPPGIPPEPPPPEPLAPSSLLVSLKSPVSDDGALLFELKGPGLGAVTPTNSTWAFSSEMIGDSVLRVAIVGLVSNGALLSVKLSDRRHVSVYQATILDVTDRTGQLRDSLAAYSIQITGY
jgi:hypothetical protein